VTRLAAVLCSLLWVTLLGQGVGLGDPQRALPTPPRWDSVTPGTCACLAEGSAWGTRPTSWPTPRRSCLWLCCWPRAAGCRRPWSRWRS